MHHKMTNLNMKFIGTRQALWGEQRDVSSQACSGAGRGHQVQGTPPSSLFLSEKGPGGKQWYLILRQIIREKDCPIKELRVILKNKIPSARQLQLYPMRSSIAPAAVPRGQLHNVGSMAKRERGAPCAKRRED